jgi:hypothetical protein
VPFWAVLATLPGMKILLEITILIGLNLFFFGFLQRKMALLVIVQQEQLAVYKRTVKKPMIKERDRIFWMVIVAALFQDFDLVPTWCRLCASDSAPF